MPKPATIRDRIVELRRVRADSLIANPKNWRRHPTRQVEAMKGVLREVGYADALLARETPDGLVLIDGHLRASVTPSTEVPVLVLDVTEAEADTILATLDPLAAMAETDAAQLRALLDGVTTGEAALQEMIAGMAKDIGLDLAPPQEDPGAQIDRAATLAQEYGIAAGQIWQLGDHRLAIGDCTDTALVAALLDGRKPRYGMHDPPYGINVVSGAAAAIGGSKGFGKIGFTGAVAVNQYRPVHGDDKPFDPSYLLSVCPDSVLWGANYYADKLPPKKGWIVWDKKGREDWRDNFSDCELAWSSLPITTRIYRHVWMGMVQEGEREARVHPTQKPAALFESIMRDLFVDDGLVIDFYAGSGPTIVACERLGRPVCLMEIEPEYGAVIIKRWEELTDGKAALSTCLSDRGNHAPTA